MLHSTPQPQLSKCLSMNPANETADTVLDSAHASQQSITTTEPDRTDVLMHNQPSSSQSTAPDDYLSSLYPALGCPPAHWRDDLLYLIQHMERTYLNDMETEFT
ncbi:hypothetical protein FRC11_006138, partial [Ceratobasidium sp. 423]